MEEKPKWYQYKNESIEKQIGISGSGAKPAIVIGVGLIVLSFVTELGDGALVLGLALLVGGLLANRKNKKGNAIPKQ